MSTGSCGSGANRTISILPARDQFGQAEITITVDDGEGLPAQTKFRLIVEAVNDPPRIHVTPTVTMPEDPETVPPIEITVDDVDGPIEDIVLRTPVSLAKNLIPDENITLTADGPGRYTMFVRPAPNRSGTTTTEARAR